MKINRLLVIFLALLSTACTFNKLDEKEKVDCSISTLDFTTSVTDTDCGQINGQIVVVATGGIAPYTFILDNGTAQSTGDFSNLSSGNHRVTIMDDVLCSISKDVSVGNIGGFQASAAVTTSGCKTGNGNIVISANNGVEPYTYALDNGSAQSSATFLNLTAGEYEVMITDDTGCSFLVTTTISTGISYNASVKSIIANSCATTNCHDGSSSQTNFTTFSNVQNRASSIKSRTQSGNMPKNGSLTQAQKDAIACWVDDGAKDN